MEPRERGLPGLEPAAREDAIHSHRAAGTPVRDLEFGLPASAKRTPAPSAQGCTAALNERGTDE